MALIYSCDSHVVEPASVFDGLAERFGDRAPRVVSEWKGQHGIFLAWPKLDRAQPVGRLGIAGHRLDQPETQRMILGGWDAVSEGMRDPAERLKEQDRDGVAGEVLYPSINMFTYGVPDRDVMKAIFQRHNDWLWEFCSAAPERLIPVALVPLPEIDASIGGIAARVQRSASAPSASPAPLRQVCRTATRCTSRSGQPPRTPAYRSACISSAVGR